MDILGLRGLKERFRGGGDRESKPSVNPDNDFVDKLKMNMITNSDSPEILAAREKMEKARTDLQQKIEETNSKTDSEAIMELLEVLMNAHDEYRSRGGDFQAIAKTSL